MLTHHKTHYFTLDLLFMLTILHMKFNYYELSTSVNKGFHASGNSTQLLRFRDFEPRSYAKRDMADADMARTQKRQTAVVPLNTRRSRGFQFHADEKDLSVDLEFIIPFVRIPIERSMDMTKAAFRNIFNLNLHSILTTGAVVAVGGIFAVILKLLFTPFAGLDGYRKASRNSEEYSAYSWNQDNLDNTTQYAKATPMANTFITYLESKLYQHNIDLSKCIQKSICDFHKCSDENISGTVAGVRKIIEGILSLHSIRNVLSGTAVQHAMDTAKSGKNCSEIYSACNWKPSAPKMLRVLTKALKYLNIT